MTPLIGDRGPTLFSTRSAQRPRPACSEPMLRAVPITLDPYCTHTPIRLMERDLHKLLRHGWLVQAAARLRILFHETFVIPQRPCRTFRAV